MRSYDKLIQQLQKEVNKQSKSEDTVRAGIDIVIAYDQNKYGFADVVLDYTQFRETLLKRYSPHVVEEQLSRIIELEKMLDKQTQKNKPRQKTLVELSLIRATEQAEKNRPIKHSTTKRKIIPELEVRE